MAAVEYSVRGIYKKKSVTSQHFAERAELLTGAGHERYLTLAATVFQFMLVFFLHFILLLHVPGRRLIQLIPPD